MHGLSSCALHEIVKRTADDQMLSLEIDREPDVASIAPLNRSDGWPLTVLENRDKRIRPIAIREDPSESALIDTRLECGVNRREDSAVKGTKVWSEDHIRPDLLRHLWLMAMREYSVWLLAHFTEEALQRRRSACSAHSTGAVNDDGTRCEKPGFHERAHRQDDRGWVAARDSNQLRGCNCLPIEFRDAVDAVRKPLRMSMIEAVVRRIRLRVAQAKRCREIEHGDALCAEVWCEVVTRFVRRGKEDRIGLEREDRFERTSVHLEISPPAKAREQLVKAQDILGACCGPEESNDFNMRVLQQDADDL